MYKPLLLAFAGVAMLAACEPRNARQADANCVVGTTGAAVVGGIAGNQIGGGSGRTLATALGAAAGGLAGSSSFCQ
ncbi:glycine zipper 2TM domain-containing protein [Pseudooceanicola sp. LIPI14-2-Ac024]|uniref:glycine zipper 2TM domain-containing protein n=1 Tax=Pseudooceanicola sp. LIPI14-2-Ac024 TaxID=3344875 RepID=UPI0035D12D92